MSFITTLTQTWRQQTQTEKTTTSKQNQKNFMQPNEFSFLSDLMNKKIWIIETTYVQTIYHPIMTNHIVTSIELTNEFTALSIQKSVLKCKIWLILPNQTHTLTHPFLHSLKWSIEAWDI